MGDPAEPRCGGSARGAGEPGSSHPPGSQPPEAQTPDFARSLFQSLVDGTKASNTLPAAADHEYASTFPPFSSAMDGLGERLSGMVQGLMEHQPQQPPERYGALDDVSDRFESVVDLSDRLLERVDVSLDAARAPPAAAGRAGARL